jgi:uncharacterized membrane protein
MTDYSAGSFFIKPSSRGVNDFEDLINRDYQIDIRKWLGNGWEIFKANAGPSIAFAVLAGICYAVLLQIPFAGLLIMYPLMAGFIIISLMFYQNKTAEFKNYFGGFRHFLPLLLFTIVSTLFITIGMILLIIPGIYLSIAYVFAPFLIIEKNIDFWPAMEISRKKVNKHFFGMLSFSVVIIVINMVGCIPAFLGLFITIPLTISMITAAYKDIFMDHNGTDKNSEAVEPAA